jgi:hypothetical protein
MSAHEVTLWVTVGNAPARDLYASIGFCDRDEVQPLPSDPSKNERRMSLAL